ncbi:MAG TPA: glycosyltransferase family 4 protein [Candidatus Polarisedimenticolaceae bacterium]
MKILFISQFIARPDQPGQNRIFDFLQRLVKEGHRAHVVTCGVHYLTATLDAELARAKFIETRWGDVDVTLTYATPGFRSGTVARLRSYLSFVWYAMRATLRERDVDAIMVSIQPMFVAPLAWFVAKLRRVPFILEVRDIWPDVAVEMGMLTNPLMIGLGRRLERFVYRSAHHIIVIGPEMKRLLVARGVPESRIDVVPQGFQPPPSPPSPAGDIRERLGLQGKFAVMYTGSFGVANNDLPMVLDAASRLRDHGDIRFVLVGDGNRKQEYVERCRREGLTNVQFEPMVSKNEVHSMLSAADACVMTLPPGDFFRICLQNKIFDYLGNGKPVVAAVAGDQEDLLRTSGGGLVVPPGDLDGLCRSVLQLRDDPELRRRIGESGRSYVGRHLMRDDLLEQYVRLLERTVNRA